MDTATKAAQRIRARWESAGHVPTKGTPLDMLNYRSTGDNNTGLNWTATQSSADSVTRWNLWQLRDKSRVLESTNPTAERIFSLWESNILSANGFTLQMQVKQESPITLQGGKVIAAGTPDTGANKAIEDAWWDFWHTRGHCDTSGELVGLDLEKLVLRGSARDGVPLVRLIRGFDNQWNFAVQPLEIDQLDLNFNQTLRNGNEIRMAIEVDKWGRRIAAHVTRYEAGDWERSGWGSAASAQDRIRIPFEGFQTRDDDPTLGTILAPIRKRRGGQTLDLPWLTPVIDVLNSLSKFEEAELVASRAAAEKMGFFYREQHAEEFTGEKAADGNFNIDSAPGSYQQLPVGWRFEGWDPKHPNSSIESFRKAMLRSIASGVGMAYGSVANDRSDSSFSAERTALNDEREQYKMLQRWYADSFLMPVFSAWLRMALLQEKVKLENGSPLPVTKFDKFNKPYFQGRRWGYISPLQDAQAYSMLRDRGWISDRQVIAQGGGYIEDTYSEIRSDLQLQQGGEGDITLDFSPQPKPMPERQTPERQPEPSKALKFDPNQPRDKEGQWTYDGGGGSGGGENDGVEVTETKPETPTEPPTSSGKPKGGTWEGGNSEDANPKWRFTNSKQIGQVTKPSVREWRKQPGDFTAAAQAAAHYAKRNGEPMQIVPGNSMMHKVYHILPAKDDGLGQSGAIGKEHNVAIAHTDGKIYQVRAVRK